ncbi:Pr6Pr family membrane protein [Rudaea sp.]|uniref:Pr6Pr family membrane protein n=1 Tax=Rudaea sp. TaxID=2136325 RepID=UPI003220465F
MPTPLRNDFRLWYARVAAATAWFALLLQLWLSIELARTNGQGAWHGVWMYFAFFTILTNLLAAAALTAAALRRSASILVSPGIVTGIAANIVLVGIAYNLLLRNTWNPQGLQLLADVLLHDIDPPLFLGWWWLAASARPSRYAEILTWACYPIAYFAYAMARGAVDGFYPYPFVDVPELGIARVLANALAILAGFIAVAALLVALARFRAQRAHA